jgi:hypothetical protein
MPLSPPLGLTHDGPLDPQGKVFPGSSALDFFT